MLSDILATIVAFISIILLLSIVVTTLVQISQAILRLRGRNLMKGLAALLINARETDDVPPTADELKQAKLDATKVLNAPNVALTDRVRKPDDRVRYWLAGPKVSWLDPQELAAAVEVAGVDTGNRSPTELAEDFKKSEAHLKKRFLRITRGWSVFWALVVAAVFQVSAPALYNELASDSERRDRIVASTEDLLTYHAESVATSDFNLVAPEALERLAERYPEHAEAIEQASGVGTTRPFVLEELELALEDVPERDDLVREYDDLITAVAQEQMEATSANLQYAVGELKQFDIEIWPRKMAYYYATQGGVRWDAIIGVLITGILLSFGGAFWFEQLRNIVALRDALSGKTDGDSARKG